MEAAAFSLLAAAAAFALPAAEAVEEETLLGFQDRSITLCSTDCSISI